MLQCLGKSLINFEVVEVSEQFFFSYSITLKFFLNYISNILTRCLKLQRANLVFTTEMSLYSSSTFQHLSSLLALTEKWDVYQLCWLITFPESDYLHGLVGILVDQTTLVPILLGRLINNNLVNKLLKSLSICSWLDSWKICTWLWREKENQCSGSNSV